MPVCCAASRSRREAAPRPGGGEKATSVLQAIVLGVVQGLTEFAPVSSSGHLVLVPWLLGWRAFQQAPDLAKTFEVALHVGTFAGAVAYFWRDVVRYAAALGRSVARRSVRDADERVAWFLVVGTVPAAVVGGLADDFIERDLGQVWLVATMLVVFGVLLWAVDRSARQVRSMEHLTLGGVVAIGVAQALALSPGVSRSGVTMTAARGMGLTREEAARFSFLLSIPIVAGAGLIRGVEVLTSGLPPGTAGPFLWGTVASAVSGFLVIWGLLAYLRRRDFAPFAVYRLALGALAFGLIAAGVRSASGL